MENSPLSNQSCILSKNAVPFPYSYASPAIFSSTIPCALLGLFHWTAAAQFRCHLLSSPHRYCFPLCIYHLRNNIEASPDDSAPVILVIFLVSLSARLKSYHTCIYPCFTGYFKPYTHFYHSCQKIIFSQETIVRAIPSG